MLAEERRTDNPARETDYSRNPRFSVDSIRTKFLVSFVHLQSACFPIDRSIPLSYLPPFTLTDDPYASYPRGVFGPFYFFPSISFFPPRSLCSRVQSALQTREPPCYPVKGNTRDLFVRGIARRGNDLKIIPGYSTLSRRVYQRSPTSSTSECLHDAMVCPKLFETFRRNERKRRPTEGGEEKRASEETGSNESRMMKKEGEVEKRSRGKNNAETKMRPRVGITRGRARDPSRGN